MDRSIQLRHLAAAEQRVTSGAHNISKQELCVEALDCRGYDATLARSVLETFLIAQAHHVAHRDYILRELRQ